MMLPNVCGDVILDGKKILGARRDRQVYRTGRR
jgi:hypothetical protein